MDETRDIAITAAASSKSAHHRLDRYNGQIARLGDEMAGLRAEHGAAIVELRVDVAKIKTRAGIYAALGAFVAVAIAAPVAVAVLLKVMHINATTRPTEPQVAHVSRYAAQQH